MDWSKAKTIIIIALVLANLFLLTVFLLNRSKEQMSSDILEKDVIELLQRNGIELAIALPEYDREMPKLKVEYERKSTAAIQNYAKMQETLSFNQRDEANVVALTDRIIESCGPVASTAKFDKLIKRQKEADVYYKNIYNGVEIADSYICFTVEDGAIKAVKSFWLKPIEHGRKLQILSPAEALLNLMQIDGPIQSAVINKMDLIYWLDQQIVEEEDTVTDTAFPAWRIGWSDGRTEVIPAYKGIQE
ncbi:MAG TPA: hypothetical protein GX726_04290 [Clostridiales bacterium]|jgi:regulatory protein YycI of two-component signal transduction system YycFG|nr:hypothetical protein [Clostridiales bacterium]